MQGSNGATRPFIARNKPTPEQEELHDDADFVGRRQMVWRHLQARQEVVEQLPRVHGPFARNEDAAQIVKIHQGRRVESAEMQVVYEVRKAECVQKTHCHRQISAVPRREDSDHSSSAPHQLRREEGVRARRRDAMCLRVEMQCRGTAHGGDGLGMRAPDRCLQLGRHDRQGRTLIAYEMVRRFPLGNSISTTAVSVPVNPRSD